jgi:hypothetical protein
MEQSTQVNDIMCIFEINSRDPKKKETRKVRIGVLAEFDTIFDGEASANYLGEYRMVNWG